MGFSCGWVKAVAKLVLLPTVVAGILLVSWPSGWMVNRLVVRLYFLLLGAKALPYISVDEFSDLLNVILFFLPSMCAGIIWSKKYVVFFGILATVIIELAQFYSGHRDGNIVDVLTNSFGSWLGVKLGMYLNSRCEENSGYAK